MSLTLEERKTLVQLEFEKADTIMSQIELFHQNNFWDTIANRLYYAVYHAVVALFLHDGIEVGTHKTTINRFGNYYVMTGIFTSQDGKLFSVSNPYVRHLITQLLSPSRKRLWNPHSSVNNSKL